MLTRGMRWAERGTSLIEVLVTMVILAIGLLGVAGLQSKMGASEIESYQREQALLALSDMTNRIGANASQAAGYITTTPLGTLDGEPTDCSTQAVGQALDWCQWSQLLKGASEQTAAGNVGGMTNARGCITQIAAANATLGICTPGVYQVEVAWQGMTLEPTPTLTCAQGDYGTSPTTGMSYRRVIGVTVTVPTTSCYTP